MINWNCKDQQNAKKLIEQDFASGNFAQTIMLSSFDGESSLEFAKDVAKLVGCENGSICNKCNFCRWFEAGTNTDCFIFENNEEAKFGIEEVRNLKQNLQLSTEAKARVVIIQNVERLSIPCLNSLLKILEEPPSKVHFIMTTQNYKEVLPTIVSRSRIFLLSNKMVRTDQNEWIAKLASVKSRADGLMLAEEISKQNKSQTKEFFGAFIEYLKKNGEYHFLEEVQKTYNLVNQNVNSRIALEVLFLRYIGKCSIV
jgi:DNA polymerase III delta prime subunit